MSLSKDEIKRGIEHLNSLKLMYKKIAKENIFGHKDMLESRISKRGRCLFVFYVMHWSKGLKHYSKKNVQKME